MNPRSTIAKASNSPIPPETLAEAGVWIARLHGDGRGRSLEEGFRRWLQADPVNARAFEFATDVWDDSANLRRVVSFSTAPCPKPSPRWGLRVALAAAATVVLAVGVVLHMRAGVISTDVGEQRQLTLEDGTRIFLNTDSRLVVDYDEKVRHVEVRRGEALFTVAKNPERPFLVEVGDQQVKALGTEFVVRMDASQLTVTLIEGSVAVDPLSAATGTPTVANQSGSAAATTPSGGTRASANAAYTLTPGQRLTFAAGEVPKVDTPSLENLTAWQEGRVWLDDTPLNVAAAEMNRYNTLKVVIESERAKDLRVSGLFQAGDSISFANAMALTYGLQVVRRKDLIVLSDQRSY